MDKSPLYNDLLYIYNRMEIDFWLPLLMTLFFLFALQTAVHLLLNCPNRTHSGDMVSTDSTRFFHVVPFNVNLPTRLAIKLIYRLNLSSIRRLFGVIQIHLFYIVRVALAQTTVPLNARFFIWMDVMIQLFMFFINIYYTFFIKTDKVQFCFWIETLKKETD